VILTCPSCRREMSVADGSTVTRWCCPHCRAVFDVAVPVLALDEVVDAEVVEDDTPVSEQPAPVVALPASGMVANGVMDAEVLDEEPANGPQEAIIAQPAPVVEAPIPPPAISNEPGAEVRQDMDPSKAYEVLANERFLDDLWNVKAGALGVMGTLSIGEGPDLIRCLALNAETRVGLVGCGDTILVFDLGARKRAYTFQKQDACVTCLAISSDGRLALSGDDEGGLVLWDINDGQRLRWFEGNEDVVRSVAFSRRGRFIASGGDDGSTRLWEVANGQEQKLFKARWDGPVKSVAFSPDGRQLLAAGVKVRTWSTNSGEPLVRFAGGAGMSSAAFSRDGLQVAACAPDPASANGFRARCWRAKNGWPLPGFEPGASGRVDASVTAVAPGSLRVLVMGKKEGVKRGGALESAFSSEAVAAAMSVGGTLAMNMALGAGGGWGFVIFRSDCGFNTRTYDADPYCMKCWSFSNGLPDTHSGGKKPMIALAVSADGTKALSATPSNEIYLWSLPS
jgi:WD40 repeat protein